MSEFSRFDENFERLGGDETPLKNRGRVMRLALFYSFWATILWIFIAIALFKIVTGDSGFLVMLFVGALFGLPASHVARQYLQDLRSRPVVHEGDILRKWSKGNIFFFLFPSYYIMVKDHVYSIPRNDYAFLLEDDLVRVTCYPHSLAVEQIERYDETHKRFVPSDFGTSNS